MLTVDKKTGNLPTSPDIISRGLLYMRDNEETHGTPRIEPETRRPTALQRIDSTVSKLSSKTTSSHITCSSTPSAARSSYQW